MSSIFYAICNECKTEFDYRINYDCPDCGSPDLSICPVETRDVPFNPKNTWLLEVIDTFADMEAPPVGHLVDCRYCGSLDFVRTRGSDDPTYRPCNTCKEVDTLHRIASNTDELWCAKCWKGFGLASMLLRWHGSQGTEDCCPLCDGDLIHPDAVSPGFEVIDDTPFFRSEGFHPYALMLLDQACQHEVWHAVQNGYFSDAVNEDPGLEF